jgi:hypothetical protein
MSNIKTDAVPTDVETNIVANQTDGDGDLLFGWKRKTAKIAMVISFILIAIGTVFAIFYGRPKVWKRTTEYVDGIRFGDIQMISSDGSTLAVIESGPSTTIRSVQVFPTVSSNDDRKEATVRLSPFLVEDDDDYPLPVNSEFRKNFDLDSPFYFEPRTTYYDLSISGDGNTLVVFGLAFMMDRYRSEGDLGYHALCNTTAGDVTDKISAIYGLRDCMYSRVSAYKRSSSSDEWERLGAPIEHMMERPAFSSVETNRRVGVSLSNDGETLAVGYIGGIDVYNLQDGMWKQIGDSILAAGRFGESTSLNADGSRVATGGGVVYEYDTISDSWNALGAASSILSPLTVSLSGSGNRLAVGYKNLVRVYDYNMDSDSWALVGDNIDGFEECCGGGEAGSGVTLSEDGNTFVCPASDSSLVQPYRFKEGKGWEPLGRALETNRASSPRASISNNGDRLVIGDVAYFEGESYVNVYDLRRGI